MAKNAKSRKTKASAPIGRKPMGRRRKRSATAAGEQATNASTTPKPESPKARLPPPGTVIRKLDRNGDLRCECKIEEEGRIRYRGKVYTSLSAAALAAAKDLGLESKALNGRVFWGLVKPARFGTDPIDAVERAWARYSGVVQVAVGGEAGADRSKLRMLIGKHVQALSAVSAKVA